MKWTDTTDLIKRALGDHDYGYPKRTRSGPGPFRWRGCRTDFGFRIEAAGHGPTMSRLQEFLSDDVKWARVWAAEYRRFSHEPAPFLCLPGGGRAGAQGGQAAAAGGSERVRSVSRIVQVPSSVSGVIFAGIERDDGAIVLADDYAPPGGICIRIDGPLYWFVPKREFAAELAAAGLQSVWTGPTDWA